MRDRRTFLKTAPALLLSMGSVCKAIGGVLAEMGSHIKKTVIPKGTSREALVDKNPRKIDAGNVPVTPLGDFGVMGLEDYEADLEKWRLLIDGSVKRSMSLTYDELLQAPSLERTVLLICPGVFVNQGKWKGVSVADLLKKAGAGSDVTHVTFRGPEGRYMKTHRVPIEHVLTGKAFLAYEVNGKKLPKKHGFPLRLVSEEDYGYDWIKYVYKVTADVIST